MVNEPEMRASDADRDQIVARLRDAHVQGRLSADEFNDRLNTAAEAKTYGELKRLVHDLPVVRSTQASAAPRMPEPPMAPPPVKINGKRVMRVLWTLWGCVVGINMVIWALVSLGQSELMYFWPMWVGGPSGVLLICAELLRRAARE